MFLGEKTVCDKVSNISYYICSLMMTESKPEASFNQETYLSQITGDKNTVRNSQILRYVRDKLKTFLAIDNPIRIRNLNGMRY